MIINIGATTIDIPEVTGIATITVDISKGMPMTAEFLRVMTEHGVSAARVVCIHTGKRASRRHRLPRQR